MAQITIEGSGLYDGTYDVVSDFTMNDYRTIKRISGLTRGELTDALGKDDALLEMALAVIAIQHKHPMVTIDEDAFWNAPSLELRFNFSNDAEEADAGPPASGGPESSAGDGSTPTSGSGSDNDSVQSQETSPSPTGAASSGLSAAPPVTSPASVPLS